MLIGKIIVEGNKPSSINIKHNMYLQYIYEIVVQVPLPELNNKGIRRETSFQFSILKDDQKEMFGAVLHQKERHMAS